MLDDVLEECVLAALGRARVGLDREHLFAEQARQQRLELCGREAGEDLETVPCERLAEHRPVLDKPALLLGQAVEPGRNECVERLRHVERRHGSRGPVDVSFLHEQAAVEQHADCLDRIERHALGPIEDPVTEVVGQAGYEPREELGHQLGDNGSR